MKHRTRYRVERAGYAGHYERGWFASATERHRYTGDSAWFATWAEAMEFVTGGPLIIEATA